MCGIKITDMKSSDLDNRIKNIRSQCINGVYAGNLVLDHLNLTELPDLSDIIVNGNFNCSGNKLKSLKGSPKSIGRRFICYLNGSKLRSLEGGPDYIGEKFCMYKEEWVKVDLNSSLYLYLALNNKLYLPLAFSNVGKFGFGILE